MNWATDFLCGLFMVLLPWAFLMQRVDRKAQEMPTRSEGGMAVRNFLSNEDYIGYSEFLLRPDSRAFLKINNVLDLDEHMGKQSLFAEYLHEKESKTVKEI